MLSGHLRLNDRTRLQRTRPLRADLNSAMAAPRGRAARPIIRAAPDWSAFRASFGTGSPCCTMQLAELSWHRSACGWRGGRRTSTSTGCSPCGGRAVTATTLRCRPAIGLDVARAARRMNYPSADGCTPLTAAGAARAGGGRRWRWRERAPTVAVRAPLLLAAVLLGAAGGVAAAAAGAAPPPPRRRRPRAPPSVGWSAPCRVDIGIQGWRSLDLLAGVLRARAPSISPTPPSQPIPRPAPPSGTSEADDRKSCSSRRPRRPAPAGGFEARAVEGDDDGVTAFNVGGGCWLRSSESSPK